MRKINQNTFEIMHSSGFDKKFIVSESVKQINLRVKLEDLSYHTGEEDNQHFRNDSILA